MKHVSIPKRGASLSDNANRYIMTIGIYCIAHTDSGKRYIGKSINVEARFNQHKSGISKLIRDGKPCDGVKKSPYSKLLCKDVMIYGWDAFEFSILQSFTDVDENIIAVAELHWIRLYDSVDPEKGYNKIIDSSTPMICKPSTRVKLSVANSGEYNPNYGNHWDDGQKQRMSEIKKRQLADKSIYGDEWRRKISDGCKGRWDDAEKKATMAKKVSEKKSIYRFFEYDKISGDLKKVWEGVSDIIQTHPDYHIIAIYSVCAGHKKSYRGSIWRKELKI